MVSNAALAAGLLTVRPISRHAGRWMFGGVAVFVGGWALEQLWLFWLAPIAGAVAAGLIATWLHEEDRTAT